MEQEEIIEGNKLIAEFMGASVYKEEGRFYSTNWKGENRIVSSTPVNMWGTEKETLAKIYKELLNESYGWWGKYHSSWDWLMPVVEKIAKIKMDGYDDYYYPRTFCMPSNETGELMIRFNSFHLHMDDDFKKAVWLAVVEFIKWYNQNKQQNEKAILPNS